MKKIFLIVLFITSIAYAHRQHVHQYITIEAYNLLKLQLGYDITKLYSKLGGTSSWYVGDYAWQRGFITTGAWREDEEDVVYGYSKSSPPTLTGITGSIYSFISVFGGLTPDGFVSSTHFWYADDGDYLSTTMRAGVTFLGTHVTSFTIPNAWQKMAIYSNGNWEVLGNTDWLFYVNGKKARLLTINGQSIRRFYYNNLISLFRNGSVQIKNLANANYILDVESGQDYLITPSNGTITLYLNDEVKNNTVWEILGRMCHLLQDMSVPAHANIDPHGDDDALIPDYYENYFGYNFYWNAQNVYAQLGGMINPYQYQPTNPLHFLMYTTNQMANHFATQGPHKKKLIMIILAEMERQQKLHI